MRFLKKVVEKQQLLDNSPSKPRISQIFINIVTRKFIKECENHTSVSRVLSLTVIKVCQNSSIRDRSKLSAWQSMVQSESLLHTYIYLFSHSHR